jgi:hypothetical protein
VHGLIFDAKKNGILKAGSDGHFGGQFLTRMHKKVAFCRETFCFHWLGVWVFVSSRTIFGG